MLTHGWRHRLESRGVEHPLRPPGAKAAAQMRQVFDVANHPQQRQAREALAQIVQCKPTFIVAIQIKEWFNMTFQVKDRFQ